MSDTNMVYEHTATSAVHALSQSAWEALVEGSSERPRTPTPVLFGAPSENESALAVTTAAAASVATALRAAGAFAAARNGTTPDLLLHGEHVLTAVVSERQFSADDEVATMMFAPLSRFWRAGDGWVRTHANVPWRIGRRVLREETSLFEPMREMRYRVLSGIPVRDYEGIVELRSLASGTHITWSSCFRGKPAIAGPLVRRSLQAQFPRIRTHLCRRG